mmetsp:Transcript_2588/g.6010  ORF Transcript_2588/g.6010 Transcript_2588/m.6010 type:complete len:93 (+) Transcript_2588:590-868(+)
MSGYRVPRPDVAGQGRFLELVAPRAQKRPRQTAQLEVQACCHAQGLCLKASLRLYHRWSSLVQRRLAGWKEPKLDCHRVAPLRPGPGPEPLH